MMAEYDIGVMAGAFFGGLIILPLLSAVFRYAFLGHEGSKVQKFHFIFIAAFVAIGIAGLGDGADGFVNRALNTPDLAFVIGYGFAGLAVAGFISKKAEVSSEFRTTIGAVARFFSLLFALPIGVLALMNLVGGGYTAFTYDKASHERDYVKEKMLEGDMSEMWQLIEERAPSELKGIVERLTVALQGADNEAEVLASLNFELAGLRLGLSKHYDFLSDDERKKIIDTGLGLLKKVKDDAAICVDVAETGGQNLPPQVTEFIKPELLAASIAVVDGLLNARDRAIAGKSDETASTTPPTDADYAALGQAIVGLGVTPEALNAAIMGDTSHPGYCEGSIGFSEGLLKLEGQAGKAVRWEVTKFMVSGVAG
jgi:hypothetical protein